MKKYIIMLAIAMLVLAFAGAVEGRNQNANNQNINNQNEINSGHHNTIVTDINQAIQAYNGNNMPYGQLKKFEKTGNGIAGSNLDQSLSIGNQILGGHHNTIIVGSQQNANISGSSANGWNSTALGNISQTLKIGNQIDGGHHNAIMVGSIQNAWINAASSGNISQVADINNLISGGHHNVIWVGSSQTIQ